MLVAVAVVAAAMTTAAAHHTPPTDTDDSVPADRLMPLIRLTLTTEFGDKWRRHSDRGGSADCGSGSRHRLTLTAVLAPTDTGD